MTSLSTLVGDEVDQSSYGLDFNPPPAPTPSTVEPKAQTPKEEPKLDVECLCPFCGSFNTAIGKPCTNCKQEDTINTRAMTARKQGPWYVLDPHNLEAPGMNFDQLIALIHDKKVTSKSVVRGATTGQLWRLASKVRGLSREFGQCYSCGGDIESGEIICPHCDRVQTVQEHPDAIPQPAAVVEPAPPQIPVKETESPRQVREALLAEPIIHVHSLSHPEPKVVDPIKDARPVVVERSERHIPKDDLLTPRDVAKAFQLEFGPDTLERFLAKPSQTVKQIKIAMTSVAALTVAALVLWPATHMVSNWINTAPAKPSLALTSPPSVVPSYASNENHFANEIAYAPAEHPMFPVVSSTPAPTPAPIVASATMDPVVLPEPTPTVSPADDPKQLWMSALDAESTGNYAAAVQAYERIESLPCNSWPANLETRLSLARKELKGDVR